MIDVAENFVPEYAHVLCALLGTKIIVSNGNLKESSELAERLLMHKEKFQFPIF